MNKTVPLRIHQEKSPHQVAPVIWRTTYKSIGSAEKIHKIQWRNPDISKRRLLSLGWLEGPEEEVMVPEPRSWVSQQELEQEGSGTLKDNHPEGTGTKEKLLPLLEP